MTGGTYGGTDGFLYGGADEGGLYGSVEQFEKKQAELESIEPRGFAYGGAEGALYGTAKYGALYGTGPPGTDELLAETDGFGLVVTPIPELGKSPRRRLYTESGTEPEADGTIDAISMPLEANAMSGARIEMAAEPDLFRLPFGDAVLGVGRDGEGQRIFNGRIEPVEATSKGESATLELLGPLSRLDSGGVSVSYGGEGGMTHRDAIRAFYADVVSPRTNGRVRGIVETPRFGTDATTIPAGSPFEAEGTPLSVLDELHGAAGLTYSVVHGTRGDACIETFKPGTGVPRSPSWETADVGQVTPKLDPSGYATDVIVEGAIDPTPESGDPNERYRGEASVSDREVRAITGGERVVYQPAPDDDLTSDLACEKVAETLLAERRSEFSMSGSLSGLPPAPVQPGRVYRVPSMDTAAPDALTPASLPLQKAEYSFARGERSMTLSFESEQGISGLLRRADRGARAAGRAFGGTDINLGGGGIQDWAYPAQYPHSYPTGGN